MVIYNNKKHNQQAQESQRCTEEGHLRSGMAETSYSLYERIHVRERK